MKTTNLDGQHIRYKGTDGFTHTGNIVGMSADHQWYHIQSDKPNAPVAEWHFRIRADQITKYLG